MRCHASRAERTQRRNAVHQPDRGLVSSLWQAGSYTEASMLIVSLLTSVWWLFPAFSFHQCYCFIFSSINTRVTFKDMSKTFATLPLEDFSMQFRLGGWINLRERLCVNLYMLAFIQHDRRPRIHLASLTSYLLATITVHLHAPWCLARTYICGTGMKIYNSAYMCTIQK